MDFTGEWYENQTPEENLQRLLDHAGPGYDMVALKGQTNGTEVIEYHFALTVNAEPYNATLWRPVHDNGRTAGKVSFHLEPAK
jgi:hypothetical protein